MKKRAIVRVSTKVLEEALGLKNLDIYNTKHDVVYDSVLFYVTGEELEEVPEGQVPRTIQCAGSSVG